MRERIERAFERWGGFVARHPWPVLVLTLAVCAALLSGLPKLVFDTSMEGFLRRGDPTLLAYEDFKTRFGRDDAVVIGIETPEVFSLPFLERLRSYHEELERETPHVDEITSIVNARWTRGEDDELVVEDLMARWPSGDRELGELRERVFSNPLYLGTIVTDDARMAIVRIDLDAWVQAGVDEEGRPRLRSLSGEEEEEALETVRAVTARYDAPEFRTHPSGAPFFQHALNRAMTDDLPAMIRRALVTIGLILLVLFGRPRGALLPLAVVGLAMACTIGLMPRLGIPYQIPTLIVPVSLLAIGIGDSVHILAIYYQRRRAGLDRPAAISASFGHAGPAILMTSLTTAGALLSFLAAKLAPIANIGVLAPLGVMLALALTLTLLPAVMTILPERGAQRPRRRLGFLDRAVVGAGVWSSRHPWPVLAGWAVVLVVSLLGASRAYFAHDPVRWLPASNEFRIAMEHMNVRMGGALPIEMLFETGAENGTHDPAFLAALDRITAENEKLVWPPEDAAPDPRYRHGNLTIGKTISIVDLIKEINRALDENRVESYALPDSRELVAQELLLFELSGNDDLEDLTDYQYTTARMTMRVPWVDATVYGDFIERLVAGHTEVAGDYADVSVTGRLPLLSSTFTAVVHSMARSYVLALVAVTPLMILLLGKIRLGLLAMLPNLIPIIAALGLMGWFGMPLDMFTLLTGSIALGIAVDDTIHFMHGFRRNHLRSGDIDRAVRETLETTGQALLFTTLILCAGFALYATAYLQSARNFGWITCFALFVALLADILLAPALVTLAARSEDSPARET